MDKLKLHSPDFTRANIAKLAELFPNCVTEVQDGGGSGFSRELKWAIDFDLLKQELSTVLVEGPQERYQLNWPGKREALLTANAPIAKTLRPCREESVDFDTTQNLFIEGDNLDALKLLQETYLGKVKMIYIDPPYNTGKEFIYDDDFSESSADYFQRSNQKDEAGMRMVANTESNGRFHSDWLSMMYPRLKLARNLLRDDGVIFISIDDNEQANLKRLCDEIFGEDNFVAQLIWEKGRKNDAKLFSSGHDYMLVYARSKTYLTEKNVRWREAKPGAAEIHNEFLRLKAIYGNEIDKIQIGIRAFYSALPKNNPSKKLSRYSNVDIRGVWRDDNMSWPGGGGPSYELIHPVTNYPCKVPDGGWRYSTIEKMQEMIASGRVQFREDHTQPPIRKTYLVRDENDDVDEAKEQTNDVGIQVAGTYFYRSALQASNLMLELFGAKVFDSPKDHEVVARWINYVCASKKDDIILDFFSGSATTAHAVMQLNAEDGGQRRFIMVQLPETCDEKSEAYKAGFLTIADIGKERIRRAGQKILKNRAAKTVGEALASTSLSAPVEAKASPTTASTAAIDIGFRVLKIDSSNMKDVYYTPDAVQQADLINQVDNIRTDRSAEDLLFQVLLDSGVDLTLPISHETIAGFSVYLVDGNALAACFDTGISESFVKELSLRHPQRVVFRDAGFAGDSVKINIEQIFKLLSPMTEIKTI